MNNFGIVTKFTLVSHPQGEVWGGVRLYNESQRDAIKDALVNFQQKKDVKAANSVFTSYASGQVCFIMTTSPLIQFNSFESI